MNGTLAITRLHLNKRGMTFAVPLQITSVVAVITILITLIYLRSGSVPGSSDWVNGARSNIGIAFSLVWFLGYMGVQSVGTTFPFALALGATRRHFVTGTVLWWTTTAAYLAGIYTVLCAVELATGHWFCDLYIFDVYVLGSGNLARLALIVFFGVLTVFSLGGMFAASWVRFRNRGPQMLTIGVLLIVLIGIIIAVPSFPQISAAFQPWWAALAAAIIIAGSATGTWAFLRGSSIR